MMKQAAFLALGVFALAGPAFAETRGLSGFTSVEAAGNVEVEVIQGDGFSVVVDDSRADRVLTHVRGDTLEIDMRRNWSWFGSRPPGRVSVTMPEITALSAAAGSTVRAENVRADAISLDASSGADLIVSGTCNTLVADSSSGADLRARDLRCVNGSVESSSGADATVYLTGVVDVDASSGSDIRLLGGANMRNVEISSGADVHR